MALKRESSIHLKVRSSNGSMLGAIWQTVVNNILLLQLQIFFILSCCLYCQMALHKRKYNACHEVYGHTKESIWSSGLFFL